MSRTITNGVENRIVARKPASWLPTLLVVVGIAWTASSAGEEVRWRSGPARIPELDRAELAATFTGLASRPDARHVVIQFDRCVGPTDRGQLRQAGLTLLRYVGNHTFFAALSESGLNVSLLSATPFLTGIQGVERTWKLDPRILAGEVPSWAVVAEGDQGGPTVGLYVLFHAGVSLSAKATAAVRRHGATVRDELESINGLVIELPWSNVNALADEDVVQWIEWPLPRFSEVNDSNREITQANLVQAPPYSLTGSGVTVLVYDAGTARSTHVDFESRLVVCDSSGMNDHSTHVAGTIGGAGVANSTYKGMAPGAGLLSYGFQYDGTGIFLYSNPGDIEDDYDQAINVFGADIANNSIGSNVEPNVFPCNLQGDYGVTAALIDAIVAGSLGDPFRVVWANGNERQGNRCDVEGYGDYYSTAPPAGAKNHVAVGALNSNDDSMTSFSSWGPVDDGRLKPDVSAPGCQSSGDSGVTSCSSASDTAYGTKCGTSMAAPTVCGLSALLLQDFRNQFPSEPDFRNSTLKALLAHNAEDIENVGPDYKTGYGSVRIRRTIDFMRTGNFLEAQVDQDDSYSVLVLVGPDDELKVTLAWDDVPGTPNIDFTLVNDLDLRVVNASSQQYYPWTLHPDNPGSAAVRVRPDHVNNLEQVVVDNPPPGIWQVRVRGFDVPEGPQTFSLCASPEIIACSAQGIVGLDASIYACASTAEIQVVDCDLDTDGGAIETVTVVIASDSEPGAETLLLTETGPDTADFRGTIQLDVVDSPGVLRVTNGDTVTATYIDADDGQGGHDIAVTALAAADCSGPVINNVQVADVGADRATVTFQTVERSTGTARYGLSCASLTESVSESRADTLHTLTPTELNDAEQYFFVIDAVDERGYASTNDNGGLCYSFRTLEVIYSFPMDTDPGWTTEGQWAFGTPTGNGGEYGWSDPTTGHTGSNVYGYNLSGDYSNNIPKYHLTTSALDCTDRIGVRLVFQRWLGVEQPLYDHSYLQVSNDGSNWVTAWQSAHEVTDDSWARQTFDISNVADNQSEVYVRWTMGPTDSGWRYCGWNIDDVEIVAASDSTPPTCDDGIQNQDEERLDCGGPCPPCACTSDGQCDDDLFCNGAESCDAFGHCQDGTTVDCADAVGCTADSCNEDTDSCDQVPDDPSCSNGLYCDGVETCDPLLDCQAGTAVDCSDDVTCTDDSCDEATDSCTNVPNDTNCNNGQFCDGVEICDPVQDCIVEPGSVPDCNDDVDCTADWCDELNDTCVNEPNDADCNNGQFCDGVEICDPLQDCIVAPGSVPDCNDNIDCTVDSCDELNDTCVNEPNDADCNNGQYCDGIEICDPFADCVVVSGSVPNCDDGIECTFDSCDEDNDTCVNAPDDAYCDNSQYCDGVEICDSEQGCIVMPGSVPDCDDGIECTSDSCDEVDDGCANIPNDDFCDNGLFCDGAEFCDPTVGCRDGGVPCLPDKLCRESDDQCVDCLVDLDCDDQDPCTGVESCQPDGTCLSTVETDCNYNDIEDFCDIAQGTSPDCNENLIPDECDIAGGTSPDDNETGIPDECEVSPPLVAVVPHNCRKNRYISFDPGNADISVAFLVQITASTFFPDSIGTLGWVGEPDTGGISRVIDEPLFRIWPEAVVHAGDCEIVPVATYEIRATFDGVTLTDPLEIETILRPLPKWWGDCVGEFNGTTWSAPNGIVNMDDILAAVWKFKQLPEAPPLSWVDVDDEVPDKVVNFTDIHQIVLGFKGEPYPFGDPAGCP